MAYILKIWFSSLLLGAITFFIFSLNQFENPKSPDVEDIIKTIFITMFLEVLFSLLPIILATITYYFLHKKTSEANLKTIFSIGLAITVSLNFFLIAQDSLYFSSSNMSFLFFCFCISLIAMIWIFKIEKQETQN